MNSGAGRPALALRRGGVRTIALAAVVVAVLATGVSPAAAHASLLSVDPQPGGVYDEAPPAVTLRFSEPVEVALGGVRVFDGNAGRIDVGAPHHPGGRGDEVRATLPELDDGTYVVTWRVISSDAHPVEGAFTFQVGPEATTADARGLAARLLSQQGGSTAVGVLYGAARALLFAALALLIGGVVFLTAVYRPGRLVARARRAVWVGWGVAVGATVAAIGLEGAYTAALPLADVFDPGVWADVIDTRYGKVALLRLVLLAIAFPVARRALAPDARLPRWWSVPAAVVGVALAATPGLAGHASSGDHVLLAQVSDTLHVLAMACWLGGLVLLVSIVLQRPLPEYVGLRQAVNRFSALALTCVTVLVVTGGFQAWRQVGSLDELRSTDFGRLLTVKLLVVVAMIVAAAFSREVVNRQFRFAPDDLALPADRAPALVGAAPSGRSAIGNDDAADVRGGAAGAAAEDDVVWGDPADDEREAGRLRRSVAVEICFAVVVLAITSLLVNTAPARTESAEPVSLRMRAGEVFADVTIAPAVAGRNDIHVTVLDTGAETVTGVEMQLTRPGSDLAPFDVPLQPLGPGHSYAPQYDIPFPGAWTAVVRVRLGATEEAVLTDDFEIR